jgi:hypothetical protein
MQTLEQLLANTLSFDILQRETQGGKVEKAVLEVMIESNKKSLEQQLRQDTQLSLEQKEKYKKLYDNMADSIKECYLEYLRIQGRLIE